MKGSAWAWTALVLVVIIGGYYIFASNNPKPAEGEPVKVGLLVPLTGNAADIGKSNQTAFEIAVQEINNRGGVDGRPFQVVTEDSKGCDPKTAATAMQKLVNVDDVVAVYSVCSGVALSSHPIAESSGVVHFGCASNPAVTDLGDYMFRTVPSDSYAGAVAARYAQDEFDAQRVATINCDNDWCVGIEDVFTETFKDLGGEIVLEQQIKSGTTDARTEVAKIKAADPDLVYFAGYPQETVAVFKQAKELGLDVPFLGGDAWLDESLAQDIGELGDNKFFTTPAKNYSSAFDSKVNGDIAICTPDAYDIPHIWANVLRDSGIDSEALKNGLYKMAPYRGESGTISFDENGDLATGALDIKTFENGSIEDYALKVS